MDERPFPHGPLPQGPPSRRGFVVAGVLAVAAAGAGVWVAKSSEDDGGSDALNPTVSAELRAAADAERHLLATIDAALKHTHGSRGAELRMVRANHVAHLTAVQAEIADALYPATPSASRSPVAPPAGKITFADVRTAEQAAGRAAAGRAGRLTGRSAVLLASISACEATHVELLR